MDRFSCCCFLRILLAGNSYVTDSLDTASMIPLC